MNRFFLLCIVCSILNLTGCGPATVNKAVKKDQAALDSKQLYELVSGNSLILSAYNFSGTVYFDKDGLLSAIDNYNQQDIGKWDINDQNQLCMKFRVWYYGDPKCYRLLYNDLADRFTFFTSNGAAYYTAMQVQGDPSSLAENLHKKSAPRSVRKQLSENQSPGDVSPDQPSSTEETSPRDIVISPSASDDTGQTMKRLAGNCPGCKMVGIDLREASLIKANLEGADLSGADLRYANLRRANLKDANLAGALLTHANLPGADLSGANLTNCDLSGANLLLANFTDAEITGAQFVNANLERTIGLKTQQ